MYSHYEQREGRTTRDYERTDDAYETTYRSTMTPRITNVQRSRPTGLNTPGVSTRIYQSYLSTQTGGNFGPGLSSLVHFPGVPIRGGPTNVNTAVVSINNARQRDKRELETLNDKFAQYVEKVRFLEAHNRKLVLESDALRNRTGQGSSRIKEMYDIEMNEAHKLIDDTKRDAFATNAKKQQAEQELNRQRARYKEIASLRETDRRDIDAIQFQIAENEAQIALYRRRMDDLEEESRRYKNESQRLSTEVARLQNEIQNELFIRSSCEVEKLAIEDDIATLKHLHEVDLAELRSKSVSSDLNPSQFFRNELSEAIQEIRNDYETTINNRRNDLRNRYSLLINEITIRTQQYDPSPLVNEQQRRQIEHLRSDLLQAQNQNTQLRNKNRDMHNSISDLRQKIRDLKENDISAKTRIEREIYEARRKLERIEHNYTEVTASQTTLEKEIATYRELLESPNGLKGCADRIVQNAEQKSIDRLTNTSYLYINPNKNRHDSTTKTTTTISHTYINTLDTNYNYRDSNLTTQTRSLVNQPSPSRSPVNQPLPSASYYQTLSNINRNIPIHDETIRPSSSWENAAREYQLRDSVIRDYSSRETTNENSSAHGSRSTSPETITQENIEDENDQNQEDENHQNPEYETLSDT